MQMQEGYEKAVISEILTFDWVIVLNKVIIEARFHEVVSTRNFEPDISCRYE